MTTDPLASEHRRTLEQRSAIAPNAIRSRAARERVREVGRAPGHLPSVQRASACGLRLPGGFTFYHWGLHLPAAT